MNSLLKKVTLTSKKTGKQFTAYKFIAGEYETPLFFPTKIEQQYLDQYIKDWSHKDFEDLIDDEKE